MGEGEPLLIVHGAEGALVGRYADALREIASFLQTMKVRHPWIP
jgi:hypothetical protein